MVTSLVTAKDNANDRYRRYREHFDLDSEETIEKYVGILPSTGSGTLHDDGDDNTSIVRLVVDNHIILTNQSLGEKTSLNDLMWQITFAMILIFATIMCFNRNHHFIKTVRFTRERICKNNNIMYQKWVTRFSKTSDQNTSAVKDNIVTSESQNDASSADRQPIAIDHESFAKDHTRKQNCIDRGHESITKKNSKHHLPAFPVEPLIHDDTKAEYLTTKFIHKSITVDDVVLPPLYNERSYNTSTTQQSMATIVENLDHFSAEEQSSDETAIKMIPLMRESSFFQVQVAEAFSQIDDSFVKMVLADATKDAVRVAASMATFAKLGLPPNAGAQLAMHRSSSELKEQHARDREHRHWQRTSFLYQHSEREANRRAEATNDAIRETSPWLLEIYAARDKCLATVSNACFMGLAITAIMFLYDVEYFTMEALDWQKWTWQNLKVCMGCDEEISGNNSTWRIAYSGPLALSSAANLLPSAVACVVRRLMFAGFTGTALIVLTWVMEAFRTPVLVRQAVGAMLLWFNAGASTLVMKTIYQRGIPQFVIATLVSGYVYMRCDAVIHLAKKSMERERLMIEFRVGIDQFQRWIHYSPLLLVAFFVALEVTWHIPYFGR